MGRRPPRTTLTDPPCPYTTLFRSEAAEAEGEDAASRFARQAHVEHPRLTLPVDVVLQDEGLAGGKALEIGAELGGAAHQPHAVALRADVRLDHQREGESAARDLLRQRGKAVRAREARRGDRRSEEHTSDLQS